MKKIYSFEIMRHKFVASLMYHWLDGAQEGGREGGSARNKSAFRPCVHALGGWNWVDLRFVIVNGVVLTPS